MCQANFKKFIENLKEFLGRVSGMIQISIGFIKWCQTTFHFIYFGLFLFTPTLINAGIITPSSSLTPSMVVKFQLQALKANNTPYKDFGIRQAWELAHPKNKRVTGPLQNFTKMIHNSHYKMLLNHKSHKISLVRYNQKIYIFDVGIVAVDDNAYNFEWMIERVTEEGSSKNCWLTISVSPPRKVSNSI
tara:strand:- start:69 stop:635 length:567 start_codon:yes stop_codon:yes gene_type:complete